jgi:hypothetical protein
MGDDFLQSSAIVADQSHAGAPVPSVEGQPHEDLLDLIRQLRGIVETLQGIVDQHNGHIRELHESLEGVGRLVAEHRQRIETTAARVDILAAPRIALGPFAPGFAKGTPPVNGAVQDKINTVATQSMAKVISILSRMDVRIGALEAQIG